MTTKIVVLFVIGIIVAAILGYLIGKNHMKPKGDIVFETYIDEEDNTENVRCTFKLDLDIDDIVKEDYILFGVQKNREVLEYYKKEKG